MKPIIVYVHKEEKDNKIIITKDELQRIVDEAYAQGKMDCNYWNVTTTPYKITPTWHDHTEITCQGVTKT